jgi:lysozyme family protein
MTDFDRAFTLVVSAEGGFSSDADDPGNWTGGAKGRGKLQGTKYGISAMSYPTVDIAALTLAAAKAIYKRDYWDAVAGDALPWPFNYLLFDTVVNQGGGPDLWKRALQDALGVDADGNVGPKTASAARLAANTFERRAEIVGLYTAARLQRYVEKSAAKFRRGLFKRATVTAMRCAS